MHRSVVGGALAAGLLSGTALGASAAEDFDRIASFPITANLPADSDKKADAGWIGLPEITAAGDRVIVIERDNQIAENARIKKLYSVAVSDRRPAAVGGEVPVVTKTALRDLLPDLQAPVGYVLDKVESFAIDAAGMSPWSPTTTARAAPPERRSSSGSESSDHSPPPTGKSGRAPLAGPFS